MAYNTIGTFDIVKGSIGTTLPNAYVNFTGTAFALAPNGFGYGIASDELPWLTFDIVSKRTDSALRGDLFTLDYLKQYAQEYTADSTRSDPVYLRWASDGENVKTSTVHDLTYEIISDQNLSAQLGYDAAKVRVSIQHSPYWEGTSTTEYGGTIVDLGGTVYLSSAQASHTGRIKELQFGGQPGNEFQVTRNKLWAGIRDIRNGITGFRPVWEAEYGTNATDASDIAAGTTSNGTVVAVTFATTTSMAKRFSVKWENIATANYDDLAGKYLVLGRMKLSAGTVEVAAELKHGWLGAAGLESSLGVTYLSAVTDASLVNYNLVPLGMADIPPTGDRDAMASTDGGANSPLRSYGLALYAERLSAAGSMLVDCFVLIPADHLITIGSAIVDYTGYCKAYTGDDDISYAVNYTLANGFGNVEYSFENWNMPTNGGMLVVAAQGATIHTYPGTVTIDMDVIKRYRGYRTD